MAKFKNPDRVLTNDDINKYAPMVELYIRNYVLRNWSEASSSKHKGDVALGNTGMTINDIRQYLKSEVCIALYNYNPDYRTEKGISVKESTFVYGHLSRRTGGLMKRLTKRSNGYGVFIENLESAMLEIDYE